VNRLDQVCIAFIASPIANEAVHGRSQVPICYLSITNLLFGSTKWRHSMEIVKLN
jgi:hypothetical protein